MEIPTLAFWGLTGSMAMSALVVIGAAYLRERRYKSLSKKDKEKLYDSYVANKKVIYDKLLKEYFETNKKAFSLRKTPFIEISGVDMALIPSLFNVQGLRHRWLRFWHRNKTIMVTFELVNGRHRQFLVKAWHDHFYWGDSCYIIDMPSAYWNVDANMYTLDYHELYSLPVKRQIPLDSILKTINKAPAYEKISHLSNPSNLKVFIEGRVIEQLGKGSGIIQFMQRMTVIFWIIMLVAIFHLILFMWKSGMFERAKEVVT